MLNLNAAGTSNPEIGTKNFGEKAKSNEIVKANQSSEPGILEQKDNVNLDDAGTKEIKSRKLDKAPDNNAEAQKLIEMISSDKEGYKKNLSFWEKFGAFLKSIFVFTFKNASGAQFKDVLAKKRMDYFVNQVKKESSFKDFYKNAVNKMFQEQDLERARCLAAFIGVVIDNGYIDITIDEYLDFVQNLAGEIRKAKDISTGNTKSEILSSLLVKTLNRVNKEDKFGDLIENFVDGLSSHRTYQSNLRIEDFKCLINSDYLNIPGLIEYLADKIESSSNEGDIKILGDLLRTALLNSYEEEIKKVMDLQPGDEYVPNEDFKKLLYKLNNKNKSVKEESIRKLTGITFDGFLKKMYVGAENYLMFSSGNEADVKNCYELIDSTNSNTEIAFAEAMKPKLERGDYTPIVFRENFEKLGEVFESCVNKAFVKIYNEKVKHPDGKNEGENNNFDYENYEDRTKIVSQLSSEDAEEFVTKVQKEVEKSFLKEILNHKGKDELISVMGFAEEDFNLHRSIVIANALYNHEVFGTKYFFSSGSGVNTQDFILKMKDEYDKAQQSAGGAEIKTE